MKRIVLPFFLYCLVIAQIKPDEGEMESPASTAPEEAPDAGVDDSFLDKLIGDEPVVPASNGPEENAPESQGSSEVPAGESGDLAPVESTEPERAGPGDGSGPELPAPGEDEMKKAPVTYSSSPDIDIDEARVQETPDIPLFSHKAHIEDIGAECVQCHQTLFSESVRGYKVGPSMKEICSQCHNGTDAGSEAIAGFTDDKKYVKATLPLFSHTSHIQHTEKCNTCHKDIYAELKKIKTPPPMSLCMECHNNHRADANCKVCHEKPEKIKPKTHTPRWVYRNGHGRDARYDQSKCRECHADRRCNECHRGQGSFAVHRAGYRFSHGMDARQRVVNCGYCHDLERSCVQCHVGKRR